MKIQNKTMLITGASSGIGAATANAAARQGAEVILVARTQSKQETVANDIRAAGGKAHVFTADVSDPEAVRILAKQVQAAHGTPDILFNNAGAGRWLFTDETEMEDAAEMMAAPYLAAFYLTRAFLPQMLERDSGLIINMSSIAGFLPWPGATAYAAARWAMRGFTEALRADLRGTKVRTMMTAFAKVESDFWANNPGSEEKLPGAQAMIPVLTPERVAKVIVNGIRWNRRNVFAPLMMYVVLGLYYLFPPITRWLLNFTGARRK